MTHWEPLLRNVLLTTVPEVSEDTHTHIESYFQMHNQIIIDSSSLSKNIFTAFYFLTPFLDEKPWNYKMAVPIYPVMSLEIKPAYLKTKKQHTITSHSESHWSRITIYYYYKHHYMHIWLTPKWKIIFLFYFNGDTAFG